MGAPHLKISARAALAPAPAKKNTHLRPYHLASGLDGRGILCGRWLIDLGSAVKPLENWKNELCSDPRSGLSGMKKPTSEGSGFREFT